MKAYKLKQLYFPHDIYADKDENIVKMLYHFRKNINDFPEDFIRRNFFLASYGLYWQIVQYLHRNELETADIPMIADELRVDEDFIRLVFEHFELFRIGDGQIISDRVLKNLDEMMEKSNKNREAVQVRWLLSAFDKHYVEFFGEKPVLTTDEIESLKKYSSQIPDLKDKLRDILYTLKSIKFDSDINFKPCANWLLAKNNLAKLLNGEFGKLKHKATEKELKAQQRQQAEEEQRRYAPSELEQKIEVCSGKVEALEMISDYYKGTKLVIQRGNKPFVFPPLRILMTKFDITDSEVIELCQH